MVRLFRRDLLIKAAKCRIEEVSSPDRLVSVSASAFRSGVALIRAKQLIEREISCIYTQQKPMHSEAEYNQFEICYDYRRKTR
jgi:hypothetical protein